VPADSGGDVASAFCEDSWLSESDCSSDTVKIGGLARRCDPNDPTPAYQKGPPFAVGDLVVVDLDKKGFLDKGCVVNAAHPIYELQLEDGKVVRTDTKTSALFPKTLKPGDEAFMDFDERSSIKKLRQDLATQGRLGSFGVQLDSQLYSLRRIRE